MCRLERLVDARMGAVGLAGNASREQALGAGQHSHVFHRHRLGNGSSRRQYLLCLGVM